MKKMLLALFICPFFIACKSTDKKTDPANDAPLTAGERQNALTDSTNFTTLEWIDSTTRDLGKLVQDQSIEISFRFKNTGNKPLIIQDVSAQCGCTIPEKPEKAFAPGEEGLIRAKYNGSGHGIISKQIYVKANTTPSKDHTLTFNGEVQDK